MAIPLKTFLLHYLSFLSPVDSIVITGISRTESTDSLTLVCNTTASISTQVTWKKDGVAVTNAVNYHAYSILLDASESSYSHYLEVELGPPGLLGTYACNVSNPNGAASESITIQGKI